MIFGIKLFFKGIFNKGKIGLFFPYDKSENIGFPKIINLNNDMVEFGTKMYPLTQEHFGPGRFMGYPWTIQSENDAKTSIGLYYEQTDSVGDSIECVSAYMNEEGKQEEYSNTLIKPIKPSVTLPPDIFKGIISAKALVTVIQELFKKHKTQIYLIGGLLAMTAISVYFTFEVKSTSIPEILRL